MGNAQPQLPPFHPPVSANQRADCCFGLCHYCNYANDIKLRYEVLYGKPRQSAPATPSAKDTEDEEDEPTIREDNMAFEKICELETENEMLRKELAELRKQGKNVLKEEIKREDDGGYGGLDDFARDLRAFEENKGGAHASIDGTAAPRRLADLEEPLPAQNRFLNRIQQTQLRTPPEPSGFKVETIATKLKEVYVVLYWFESVFNHDKHGGASGRSRITTEKYGAMKGVYRNVDSANAAAWKFLQEQDLVFREQDMEFYGRDLTDGDRTTWGRKHIGKHGQMTFGFYEEEGRNAYVKVKRLRLQ